MTGGIGFPPVTRESPKRIEETMSLFHAICAIPHPSRHENLLAEWILARAEARGLAAMRDSAGNVILRKKASPGMDSKIGLILQAHLDMVCQAEEGRVVDFLREGVKPAPDARHPGWIGAEGTSLGADDGIGIALALTAIEAEGLSHGPLECLFTVNEEDGMDGAKGLDAGLLEGKWLINLDGEDSGELCVGCAGAARVTAVATLPNSPPPIGWRACALSVAGLEGGHTGADIHLGRANAIKLLVRSTLLALQRCGLTEVFRLARIDGGDASNAIPRSASLVLSLPMESADEFAESAGKAFRLEGKFHGATDPGLSTRCEFITAAGDSLSSAESLRLLESLLRVPEGVSAWEEGAGRSPRTSCCLGVVATKVAKGWTKLDAIALARSSSEEEKEATARFAAKVFTDFGAVTKRPADSPAWKTVAGDSFLEFAREAYVRANGLEPKLTVTHGGLECAVFRRLRPDWSIICAGPNIRHPHSPEERLELASIETTWRFLAELLATAP